MKMVFLMFKRIDTILIYELTYHIPSASKVNLFDLAKF